MKIAIYARVSTASHGQDPEVQLRELREYCQRREWEITREYVDDEGETEEQLRELRRCTHTGRPLGSNAFIQELESVTKRRLVQSNGGRPRRNIPDASQTGLDFGNAG